MATLAQYLDVDGYVLHITTALATTYTEGSATFSVGSQDDSAVPGTASATGLASHYAIVDVGGTALIEAGALAARQPVKNGFPFTVEAFETGVPKLVPQGTGFENAGAVGRVRRRKKREETVEPLKLLSDAVEDAVEAVLEPKEVEAPEPVEEIEDEPISVDDDETVISARAAVANVIAEQKAKGEAEATALRAAFEAAQQKKAAADALKRSKDAERKQEAERQAQEARRRAYEEALALQAKLKAEQDDEDDATEALAALMMVLDGMEDDDQLAA